MGHVNKKSVEFIHNDTPIRDNGAVNIDIVRELEVPIFTTNLINYPPALTDISITTFKLISIVFRFRFLNGYYFYNT